MVKPSGLSSSLYFSEAQVAKARKLSEARKIDATLKGRVAQFTFGPSNFLCAELFASVMEAVVFIKSTELDPQGCRLVLWQGKPEEIASGISYVLRLPSVLREQAIEDMQFA